MCGPSPSPGATPTGARDWPGTFRRAESGALVSGAAGQPAVRRRASGAVVGSLKGGDVQLAHPEHCLHGALGAVGVGATDQVFQH